MAFFDEIGKKVSQAGQGAAQSAKNFAAITKLNGMVSDEEKKIDNLYYQMGKAYFEAHYEAPEEPLSGFVSAIINSLSLVEQYKEQIKEIKGVSNCPNCGAEVPYTSAFCNACGTRMPVRQTSQAQPANTIQCGNCGAFVPLGYKFCTTCGSVMNAAPAPAESPMPETGMKTCPNCGKELEEGAMFCTGCGHQI